MWDELREAIATMFLVMLSWLLQKAVHKCSVSTGSSLQRFRRIRQQIPLVRYVDMRYVDLVDKPMAMVRYFDDAIFVVTDASFHG